MTPLQLLIKQALNTLEQTAGCQGQKLQRNEQAQNIFRLKFIGKYGGATWRS